VSALRPLSLARCTITLYTLNPKLPNIVQPLTSHLFIPKNDAPCTERKKYTCASVPATETIETVTGVLKEDPKVSIEVSLRRQLLDKSRESNKVYGPLTRQRVNSHYLFADLIWLLSLYSSETKFQAQHAQWPPIEAIQELLKELSSFCKVRGARTNGS
jgi:hypothetical protein